MERWRVREGSGRRSVGDALPTESQVQLLAYTRFGSTEDNLNYEPGESSSSSSSGEEEEICHHTDCQDKNAHQPLMLCEPCDTDVHSGKRARGHLRFDVAKKGGRLRHNISSRSLDGGGDRKSLEDEDDDEDTASLADSQDEGGKTSFKIKRKKGKARRCVTEMYSIGKEYFTLIFEDSAQNEQADCELVTAVKGRSLREAVKQAFDSRGLVCDDFNIFIASSNTPLPLIADTFVLGGNHLHVRAKDGDSPFSRNANFANKGAGASQLATVMATSKKQPASMKVKGEDKRQAGNQKNRHSMVLEGPPGGADSSPGSAAGSESQKLKGNHRSSRLSTWFNPFIKNQEKLEALNVILSNYSNQGLPKMPDLLAIAMPPVDENLFRIRSSWVEYVTNHKTLSKKQRDQQEAVWELIATEAQYIKKIKIIIDLFYNCLVNLQTESLLNEIDLDLVFSNISNIYLANCQFWQETMLPVIRTAESSGEPLNPSLMMDGFSRFEETFHSYIKYCLDQESCLDYIKNRLRDNDLFRTFVEWGEEQKQCGRLQLTALVVIPMQRLTKYKLLLHAALKKTERDEQRKHLLHMSEKVDKFVSHVDTALHQKHEQARLKLIIERIEGYDFIDTPNEECAKLVNEFCTLDLTCPVPGCSPKQKRNLLCEGPLKLKDPMSKMDTQVFLFTDMLLITKPLKQKGDKVKVIRPPMRLDKITVHLLKDGVSFVLIHLNEYHLASAMYTLHGDAKPWVTEITKAQEKYRNLRNKAMERQEEHMAFLDALNDEDDELPSTSLLNVDAPLSSTPMHRISSHESVSRLSSNGSVEGFMPNLSTSVSAENLPRMQQQVADSASPKLAESSSHSHPPLERSRSPRRSQSQHLELDCEHRTVNERSKSQPTIQTCFLAKDITEYEEGLSDPLVVSVTDTTGASASCATSSNASDNKPTECLISQGDPRPNNNVPRTKQAPLVLANRPDLVFIDDDGCKSKLNQRRVSRTEKRYHTADSVHDIKKDKDPSIHKRLSWNFPASEANNEERSRALRTKTFSSDSLMSMPSSSGVSSTQSLHGASDLIEEQEVEENNNGYEGELRFTDTQGTIVLQLEDPYADEEGTNESCTDTNSNQGHLSPSHRHTRMSSKTMSKSLPDIAQIPDFRTGQVKDGIASVEVPVQRHRMSYAQILAWKKQLLLNSTIEASEV